jgi:hypothetical protein
MSLRKLTLNQRVPGSSPGAPTTQSSQTITLEPANRKAAFAAISRYIFQALFGLCEQMPSQRRFMRAVSGRKNPVTAGVT